MKITKYSIFVNGQNDKKEIAEMILLLTKNRVQRNQIRIYDVSEEKQIKLYFCVISFYNQFISIHSLYILYCIYLFI